MADDVDPVVVGIDGGHGGAPPCALPDGAAPVALVVDLLVADPVLDPPPEAGVPDVLGRVDVGTLRGSQPKAIEQVGFAGLVVKLLGPPFCCGGWVAVARPEGAAAAAAGFCMV